MPLLKFSIQHGQTLEEARRRLETAIHEIRSQLSALVQRVEWSSDRQQVRLDGIGFWVEMRLDAQAVHVIADLPALDRLLGGSVATELKQIVQQTFQKALP